MKSSRKAPKNSSKEAKSWWKKLSSDFELEDAAAELLLATALESFDQMRAAEAILAKEGWVVEDRWGQDRAHPASLQVRDCKNAMLKALRALNLDAIPPGLPGRPPGR
jgi:phage terminase small subunit